MLIKIIIFFILFFSVVIIGYLISMKYSLRVKEISYYLWAITYLETEIIYYSTPLPIAIKKASIRVHDSIRDVFHTIYELLTNNDGLKIEEIWVRGLKINSINSSLKEDDIQVLVDFGKGLVIGDKSIQKKHFEYTKLLLEEQRRKATEERETSGKMYKKLGILLGLALVIIFI